MTSNTIEQWRPVLHFEGVYEVSNFGRVRGLDRTSCDGRCWRKIKGKILKNFYQRNGYLTVHLASAGTLKIRTVHSLVLEAFVGLPDKGYQCRHLDGSRDNNHISNLAWGTVAENIDDKKRHGTFLRGERMPAAKLTEDQVRQIRKDPRVARLIAADYGVSRRLISNIKTRTGWRHVI